MAWVNAQLKKRPAVKPVQDLRQDLRDGVILAYLIEIVGQLALGSDAGTCLLYPPHALQSSVLLLCSIWKWKYKGLTYLPNVHSFIYESTNYVPGTVSCFGNVILSVVSALRSVPI